MLELQKVRHGYNRDTAQLPLQETSRAKLQVLHHLLRRSGASQCLAQPIDAGLRTSSSLSIHHLPPTYSLSASTEWTSSSRCSAKTTTRRLPASSNRATTTTKRLLGANVALPLAIASLPQSVESQTWYRLLPPNTRVTNEPPLYLHSSLVSR